MAAPQHNVITHAQLARLGLSRRAVQHRLRNGRLYRIRTGVYAVGNPRLTRYGEWMAAVLACGPSAVLSHSSAAALWGMRPDGRAAIHVSVPRKRDPRHADLVVHRRERISEHAVTKRHGIPVTSVVLTIVDIAPVLGRLDLEAAINEADKRALIDPETLRRALHAYGRTRGVAGVRKALDHRTFIETDSRLEQRFLPIAMRAGLPKPITGEKLNGFDVDFWWPELGLVVETDGVTYHRTPASQTRDRRRDQAHTAAGLTQLRFTQAQVRYQPNYVEETLRAVAKRLRRATGPRLG